MSISTVRTELRLGIATLGAGKFALWMFITVVFRFIQRVLSPLGLCHAEVASEDFGSLPTKKNKRILYVATDNNSGSGAFRSLVALAQLERDRNGYEPLVVVPYPGTGTQLLEEAGIPHAMVLSVMWGIVPGEVSNVPKRVATSIWRNHFAVRRLTKMIHAYAVDLVHVNTTYGYVGALAAKAAGVPLVWHIREFVEEDQGASLWHRPTCNKLIASADRIIAISDCIRDKYVDVVPADRLRRIYNGIDTRRFYRAGRRVMTGDVCTFIMLGDFNGHKGHLEFCKACAEVAGRGIGGFRIWFVGRGKDEIRQECMAILEKAGLRDQVTCFGFQPNPEDYLAQADVAFMCSRAEAFGRVTVEAMLSGCLIIGANTGGTKELIKDGKTGLLFDFKAGRSPDLAEKIVYALNNKEEMSALAVAGQAEMAMTMTAERNADEIAQVYQELIKEG